MVPWRQPTRELPRRGTLQGGSLDRVRWMCSTGGILEGSPVGSIVGVPSRGPLEGSSGGHFRGQGTPFGGPLQCALWGVHWCARVRGPLEWVSRCRYPGGGLQEGFPRMGTLWVHWVGSLDGGVP
jgi:hypothetical protein